MNPHRESRRENKAGVCRRFRAWGHALARVVVLVVVACCRSCVVMDENRRKKILIYIITHLVRSNLRKRRIFSLILLHLGRSRRRIEEHRSFLARASITLQTNLAMVFSYISYISSVNVFMSIFFFVFFTCLLLLLMFWRKNDTWGHFAT